MPIDYVIDVNSRRVVATAHGTLTDADVFGYQRAVWSHPEVVGFDEIVDMTDVEHIDLPTPSGERMRALAELSAAMDVAPSRFAIVAPTDSVFGLARMYGAYRQSEGRSTKEVRVFRSMDDALAWLGADRDAE